MNLNGSLTLIPDVVFDIIARIIPGSVSLFAIFFWGQLLDGWVFSDSLRVFFGSFVGQISLLFLAYVMGFVLRILNTPIELLQTSMLMFRKSLIKEYEKIIIHVKKNNKEQDLEIKTTGKLWKTYSFVHEQLKRTNPNMKIFLPKIVAEAHLRHNLLVISLFWFTMVLFARESLHVDPTWYMNYAFNVVVILIFLWASYGGQYSLLRRHAEMYRIYIMVQSSSSREEKD